MANEYFDYTPYSITEGTGADGSDINSPMQALEVSFDLLPAPHANAPATKGFGEVFEIKDATARAHPLTAGQDQDNSVTYAEDSGSANAYVITLSPSPGSYTAGQEFSFKATDANTGSSTLDVNGLGARAIKNPDGTALGPGVIASGGIVTVKDDGTNFQMSGDYSVASAASATSSSTSASNSASSASSSSTSASNASTSASNASTSETNAASSASDAADSAAIFPSIEAGDAYKVMQVNAGETAHELVDGLRVDVLAADGTKVLDPGTNGTDATFAGYPNSADITNVGGGYQTLSATTSGTHNTAYGYKALQSDTTAFTNTAVGSGAMQDNTIGSGNTATGYQSLNSNIDSISSTAVGYQALTLSDAGPGVGENTAVGYLSMGQATTTIGSTAVGFHSLEALTTGALNTGVGWSALEDVTTGQQNIGVGSGAGGASSPFNITTESFRAVFGSNNITNAYVKVAWTVTSDARDKADITDFTHGLDYINQLRPVNFVWDDRSQYADFISDGSKRKDETELGFLAQDVQAVETSLGIDNHAIVDTSKPELFGMKETKLIPVLVNAIKELSELNRELVYRVERIERTSRNRG